MKKISILILCLILSSCGGFTEVAGLKFKKEVNSKTHGGNPGFTGDVVKLNSVTTVAFERPIGKCGASVSFFGILLPVIPVWLNFNSCDKSFDIDIYGFEILAKLKYNGTTYEPIKVEKLIEVHVQDEKYKYEYGRKFKFKIDNFWKFRMADDKAIIVIGKTKDGKEFTEELPVKWGVMTYYNWYLP